MRPGHATSNGKKSAETRLQKAPVEKSATTRDTRRGAEARRRGGAAGRRMPSHRCREGGRGKEEGLTRAERREDAQLSRLAAGRGGGREGGGGGGREREKEKKTEGKRGDIWRETKGCGNTKQTSEEEGKQIDANAGGSVALAATRPHARRERAGDGGEGTVSRDAAEL